MRRRVVEHMPGPGGRATAQAGAGRPARRRVRRPAAAARARPGRRADPGARHAQRAGRADRGRLRRARGRGGPARRLLVPAPARAPHPAAPAATYPCRSRGRGRAAPARPLDGVHPRPGRGAGQGLAAPPARGSPAAREALLPTAARRRSPGSPAPRPGSRPRPPATASPRSGSPTRRARCATSRRSTSGVTRSSNIQRTLLPVMLEWFADAPDPDAGLFGFRRISESLGGTPWYLKTLRDEGQVAERLARLLATSRYATDLLEREPQGVRMLGEDLTPLDAEALATEMVATAGRQDDPGDAVRAIRAIRRRELFRIAVGDLFGETEVADVGAGLSRLTDATLEATLDVAGRAVRRAARAGRGADPDGDRRDGQVRRLRAVLRQRCRRAVRPRPAAGRRPARGVDVRPRRRQRAAPPAAAAGRRPGARGGRRPASRGQAGSAGPHPRLLRLLLREVVEGLGGAGAAAGRRRGRATRSCAGGSPS